MSADNDLNRQAAQARGKLIEHVEAVSRLAPGRGNRQALLVLLRVTESRSSAQTLIEAMNFHGTDFLDEESDEPEAPSRYAWDLTVKAVETWAVLAARPNADADRAEHLVNCALSNYLSRWLSASRDDLDGVEVDAVSDRLSDALQVIAGERDRATADAPDDLPASGDFVLEVLQRVEDAVTGRPLREQAAA